MATSNPLDYLNVNDIVSLHVDEVSELSTKILKINKREKKQERVLLLTNKAIYNIKPGKDENKIIKIKNNTIVCQRRIDLTKLISITLSSSSNQFTINIPSEYDYRYQAFDTSHRKEIITAIYNICKSKHNLSLSIHTINQFSTAQFTVKKKDNKSIANQKRNNIEKQATIRLSTYESSQIVDNNIVENNKKINKINYKIEDHSKPEKISTADNIIISDNIFDLSPIEAPQFSNYVEINTTKIEVEEYKVDGGDIKYGTTTSKINHIQKETKPMEASKYYDFLINGYMREIEEEEDVKLIPDDIKSLCIAFYYKFLIYNEYCNVEIKKEFDAPKLLIETKLNDLKQYKVLPFGGRLVSRIPINTKDALSIKSKVNIAITYINNDVTVDGEFVCIAINDYHASVTDELDLTENEEYTIMKTSPSGWWHAVNNNGGDGWVPSNYLERKNDDQITIGVTTNPQLFMNTPIMQHPFKGQHVKHAICTDTQSVTEVINGKITNKNQAIGDHFCSGQILDVWIENNKFKIYKNIKGKDNKWSQKMCQEDILTDNDDGNMMDYYFAMTFTITSKKMVKYQISGDFV